MKDMDELIFEIQNAISVSQTGDKEQATILFNKIKPLLGLDPLHNCIFSHYMADIQSELKDELYWDLRSLEFLERLTDERLKEFNNNLSVKSLYASIYLNIAEDYRKNNMYDLSTKYINLAEKSSICLEQDGYANMIKNGIQRLKEKL